jgi:hypothetical protein
MTYVDVTTGEWYGYGDLPIFLDFRCEKAGEEYPPMFFGGRYYPDSSKENHFWLYDGDAITAMTVHTLSEAEDGVCVVSGFVIHTAKGYESKVGCCKGEATVLQVPPGKVVCGFKGRSGEVGVLNVWTYRYQFITPSPSTYVREIVTDTLNMRWSTCGHVRRNVGTSHDDAG